MKSLRNKFIAAFIAAGLSAPAAFVAYDLTLPSEGLVLQPYSDPVGLQTVCAGHLVQKGEKIKPSYTEEECMEIFASDWKKHLKQTDSAVKGQGGTFASEWQRQALNDFTFNLGINSVKGSTLLRLVNQGKHKEACEQLTRWVYAGGKKLKGLVIRRNKTMPYCLGEITPEKQEDYKQFLEQYNEISRQLEKGS
jgi:lysozyme